MTQVELIKALEREMGVVFDEQGTYETEGLTIGLSDDMYEGDQTYLAVVTPCLAAWVPVREVGFVEAGGPHLEILSKTSGYLALVPVSLYGGKEETE